MSVLVHLCVTCGHDEQWHSKRARAFTLCACCRVGQPDVNPEPIMRETFTLKGHKPETLFQPGSVRNRERVCGCERCQEIYAAKS